MAGSEGGEATYPLRAAARLTGLSPEVLRAWERRYGVVEPLRSPGGTRRYRAADLERLRLLKAAVDAGHRIGTLARLDSAELERRATGGLEPGRDGRAAGLDAVLAAIARLDADEVQRLLALQLSALGPTRFARDFALALVHEIGERWASDRLSVAAEHLASGVLRSMLGSALTPTAASRLGPRIVFATPAGERHELGLHMAALTALGAGASPVYLGADLPERELLQAVEATGAAVLGLGLVNTPDAAAAGAVAAVRRELPQNVRFWIGGAGSGAIAPLEGVERIENLGELERRVALLAYEPDARR